MSSDLTLAPYIRSNRVGQINVLYLAYYFVSGVTECLEFFILSVLFSLVHIFQTDTDRFGFLWVFFRCAPCNFPILDVVIQGGSMILQ